MFQNGKGLFGGNPMAAQPAMQPKMPRQGGLGGFLQRAQMPLAQISDVLLRYSGSGGSPVLARLQQQQDLQQLQGFRTQQAKQQQDAAMQTWLRQQEYERANPAPLQPTEFDRAIMGANIDPNSPEGQQMYRERAESMSRGPGEQFITATLPNGTFYAGPQSGLQSFMQGAAPARPQGRLSPMGGAGGNASGGF